MLLLRVSVNTLIIITVNDDIKSKGNNKVTLKYKTYLKKQKSKLISIHNLMILSYIHQS